MRKLAISLLTACLLTAVAPLPASASMIAPPNTHANAPVQPVANQALLDRLAEIESLDKSTLTRREKRALRKEVREIKKGLAADGIGGTIYISAGALILILILILLL